MHHGLGEDPSERFAALGVQAPSATRTERFAALFGCLALVAVTLLAERYGSIQGAVVIPFIPIVATVWGLADVMTAFLLLAQFYVNGTTFFAVLSGAFALSGLLTWPYLLAFPDLFTTGSLSIADQQTSAWLWVCWHLTFPIIIAAGTLVDPDLSVRASSREAVRRSVYLTLAATVASALAIVAFVYREHSALPTIVLDGTFTHALTAIVSPVIVVVTGAACVTLAVRLRRPKSLHVWLFVALFTAMLDAILNTTSPSRYSYSWYAGKMETVLTASLVLCMLMTEIPGMYRRLAMQASTDPLTGLRNRRALEDHLRLMLDDSRRRNTSYALLIVDVDHFKEYNDAYGHPAGDLCLQRIALVLAGSAARPLDFAARYGGEEFVVLLPETQREGALTAAERMRRDVARLEVPRGENAKSVVTVSIGIVFCADGRNTGDGMVQFELADRALYQAKALGRNRVVIEDYAPLAPDRALRMASR